ncbi:hypothetical protein BT93_L3373 [Corymbia citriodora subsp. variegata]|uniref:Uncharacterized protein n=1 Tax=Corymbia citriodora subsp. variegata TaxID=360336 RepID=A0A8T0CHG3_CORYI|nr:hypothetical protein BT93_L3373 [Corymbia citriodora subsp. variegata]
MLYMFAPKSSWPELLGQNASSAKATIEKENPLVMVVPLPARCPRPEWVCCDRVYASVDENGKVIEVPTVG